MSAQGRPGAGATPARSLVYGADCDPARVIDTHLFGICPNSSGSTFLNQALATCRATWNLQREGQWMLGYAGPRLGEGRLADARKLWTAKQCWLDTLTDPSAYDWPRIRKSWYFLAYARNPSASVFVTKAPPFLLCVAELARHFRNAKFLFMVRNPYAVCEGICRALRNRPVARRVNLPEAAARHAVTCFEYQRRNIETHRDRGAFFTYEAMCEEPERVAGRIRALVPALGDLNLRQRLPVHGRYHEMLTNMNARQIARLDAGQIAAFNRVFRAHRDVLEHFGYALMEETGDVARA